MEESLHVKIVADVSQATSSLKQVNTQTSNLSGNTNAATQAAQKLDKTLNSIGIRGIQFSGIISAVNNVTSGFNALRTKLSSTVAVEKIAIDNFKLLTTNAQIATQAAMRSIQAIREQVNAGIMPNANALGSLQAEMAATQALRSKQISQMFSSKDWQKMNNSLKQMEKAFFAGDLVAYREAFKVLGNTFVGAFGTAITLSDKFRIALNRIKIAALDVAKVFAAFLKTILAIAAAAAVVVALFAKVTFSVSKLGDDIDKTSQKIDMSTTAYQKWGYILERCGLDVKNLQSAIRILYRTSQGKNANYFTQLGINPEGLSKEALFESTITALQNISDTTERAQMAYKLFGNQAAELAPLLNTSAAEVARLSYQYDLLGAVMNGKVVRASANMRDAMTDLKAAFQGLKNTLGSILMPVITHIIVRITVLIAKINMVLQALFDVDLEYESVAESAGDITYQTEQTTQAVQRLKTLISGFDELNIFPSQNSGAGDLGSFLEELGEGGWGTFPTIGDILPPEAIAELEHFRDVVLPSIVLAIQTAIDKWQEFTGKFELLKTAAPVAFSIAWDRVKRWYNEKVKPFFSSDYWTAAFKCFKVGFENLKIVQIFKTAWSGIKNWFKEKVKPFFTKEYWAAAFKTLKTGWDNSGIGKVFKTAWDGIKKWFNEKVKPIFTKDWWKNKFQSIKTGFENCFIVKVFQGAWNGVKEWWQQKIAPKFTKDYWKGKFTSIKDGFNNLGIVKFFKGSWADIKTWFNEKVKPIFTKDWWKNKFQSIKDGFNNLLIVKFFKNGWQGVKDWWNEKVKPIFTADHWKNKFQKIKDGFSNIFLVKFMQNRWQEVKDWFNEKIKPKFTIDYWKNKWQNIKDGFSQIGLVKFLGGAWKGVKDWWNDNVKAKFEASWWGQKWNAIKDGLANTQLVQGITTKWNQVKKWFSDTVSGIFTKDWWLTKWDKIKEGLTNSTLVQGITTKWNQVKKWWNDNVKGIFTAQWWKNKWESIKTGLSQINLGDFFKGIVNGLISALETGINRIINGITGPILWLMKAIGVVDDNFVLSPISIPRLAKGGVIDEATVALVGEYQGAKNNPEIVAPQSVIRETIDASNSELVDVFIQCTKQIIAAIDDNKTEVNIDGQTILKSVAKANRNYKMVTGSSMI